MKDIRKNITVYTGITSTNIKKYDSIKVVFVGENENLTQTMTVKDYLDHNKYKNLFVLSDNIANSLFYKTSTLTAMYHGQMVMVLEITIDQKKEKENSKQPCKTCFLSTTPIELEGITLPINTGVCIDKKARIAYFCTKFPNYRGSAKSVLLLVICYDMDTHIVTSTTLQGCKESIQLFNAWVNAGKPRIEKLQSVSYENMMKQSLRRKKKSSDGVIPINESNDLQYGIKYNQITEAAYLYNLVNPKSGSASLVASSIRLKKVGF